MALRDATTGKVLVIKLCAEAFLEGRIVPVVYYNGQPLCPEHCDPVFPSEQDGDCIETYHAQSRMAGWSWREVWRMWRRWRREVGAR